MPYFYKNLDTITREFMLEEINLDVQAQKLYLSSRFNENGIKYYEELLRQAVIEGNESTLAATILSTDCMKQYEERGKGSGKFVKVPSNASALFAENEFNRYYIRALCIRAAINNENLQIYRARKSTHPRIESEMKIGNVIDSPQQLLKDLRDNIGLETILGLPEINSGLSVCIQK